MTLLRSLGIVGLDYCGSTLVSNVLSTLPGVMNVGESHWIVDRNLGCRECHDKTCPVFTKPLLDELRSSDLSKQSWWDIFFRHSDADLIISADKLPKHYDLFGVPDKLLLLYKNPKSNIVSWCRRKFPQMPGKGILFSENEVETGINWWITISSQIIDWLEKQECEISTLSLEQFAEDPKGTTMSLCGWLGLEIDPSSIDYWNRDLHYIGGNHSVKRLKPDKHFYRRIAVDNRWKSHLSDSDKEKIDMHREISSILERIEKISSSRRTSFFRIP